MFGSEYSLGSALYWYQKKIGSYDKQSWERSIEDRVLKGLSHAIPKKLARVKTELIDLDLIRGNYFTKPKPQQGCLAATYLGIIRVVLFPFYSRWWTEQTNYRVTCLLFALYSIQITSMYLYLNINEKYVEDIPSSEVLSPVIMFMILGILQSQIAASPSHSHKVRHTRRHIQTPSHHHRHQPFHSRKRKRRSGQSSLGGKSPKLQPKTVNNHASKKRDSDEESGLDSQDLADTAKSSTSSLTQNLVSDKPESLLIYERMLTKNFDEAKPTKKDEFEKNQEYQEIPQNDEASSADDFSPYSTVNSVDQVGWRRLSDVIPNKSTNESKEILLKRFSVSNETSSQQSRNLLNGDGKSKRVSVPKIILPAGDRKDLKTQSSTDDSEGSLTPTSPLKVGSDLDWPLVNSDNSSDEELDLEEEPESPPTNNHRKKSDFFFFCQDNESVPPSIFSFFDENSLRNEKNNQDKVSCALWQQNECQKVDLSVLDISSSIIRKVETVKHSNEYFYLALFVCILLSILPMVFRLQQNNTTTSPIITTISGTSSIETVNTSVELLNEEPIIDTQAFDESVIKTTPYLNYLVSFVILVAIIERFFLSIFYFFLLCVAERTFRERFLKAKYFYHLTSSRRARRSDLPHFRLNKVRNIKTWLSVRSYLKKHGPQRSVDVIVSTCFIIAVSFLTFLCLQLLRESEVCSNKLYCWEMVCWNLSIGVFIMRLIILGSKMNKKYRSNLSVLITEQINLYLQLEQKPHKKDEINLANHVLKLAADLLKQLESPFKISGFSANPYLYNITKVVVLSAFSAVLTELLGFKLKLYKIKLI